MKIKFYNLQEEHKHIKKNLLDIFSELVDSSQFILGKKCDAFETEFAKYIGVSYACGVGNGTDALVIALKACDIRQGDEVIIPAYTFVATAFAVSLMGAKPVLVDVDPFTHTIDVKKIEDNITSKTKAIIPVHLYGNMADMESIVKIAKKHKLIIVEDAAQAHGAIYKGKKAGSFGDVSCFSFYPAKNLGALGDGGMVVTNNKKIAENVALLRNYGQRKKYYSHTIGTNSRLDEIHASILLFKLKNLDRLNKKRREIVNQYKNALKGLPIDTPQNTKYCIPVHHLFTIQIKNRNNVLRKLGVNGIEALIHYPVPVHLQKAYDYLHYKKGDFPVSEKIASHTLSLPLYPEMTKEQVNYIAYTLKKVL